jgi:hypothetical protein
MSFYEFSCYCWALRNMTHISYFTNTDNNFYKYPQNRSDNGQVVQSGRMLRWLFCR